MTTLASPETADRGPGPRPIAAHERLTLVDVLRGFALFGVFASNLTIWLSGRVFLPPDRIEPMMAKPVNNIAGYLFSFLIVGKFITIFSFLFGLGFAIQMIRAEERGASMAPVYARRIGAMLLIGVIHLAALWYGDILNVYAVSGAALLLFRRRSDRALLIWGFVLLFVVPLVWSAGEELIPRLLQGREAVEAAAKAEGEKSMAFRASALAVFSGSAYLDMVRTNVRCALFFFMTWLKVPPFYLLTVGKFLFGFYAGRRRLFHEPEKHQKLFRRLLVWGLVAGVIGNGAAAVLRYLFISKILKGPLSWGFVLPTVYEVGYCGLGVFYVAAITLLYQRVAWRRLFSPLAPAGRMALTNYLCQSVMSVFVFYGIGLGLIGKLGPALCLVVTAGLYAVEILWSRIWLAGFRFGPAEWVWRSMTYLKLQPMRVVGERPSEAKAAA